MSKIPEAISEQVRETLASSETPPKSERAVSPVLSSGANPAGSDATSGVSEGAEAPVSPVPVPVMSGPAPATPTGKPVPAPDGNGSTSLEPIPANEPLEKWGTGGGIAWLAEYERMARLIGDAITLPDGLRGKPKDILAIALTGRELGIGFMESTRMIAIIHGRPAIAAELKVKLARRAGHDICYVDGTLDATDNAAVWCATHESDPATFSLDDARKAGLVKADSGYAKYLPDMLWARAASRLIRRHCPEVIGASLRSIEELESPQAVAG